MTGHVVVIGGGISGLAAADAVRKARPDTTVTVIEASSRLGGKLALAEVGGVTVDVGAEAMLNLRPEAVTLAREAGLSDALVYPDSTAANLWNRGCVVPMPRTMMGVPGDIKALAGVISPKGVARAALESRMAPVALEDGDDVSVGALVEERFGKEIVDRLVEPLLGGVYAGHARELSLRAAVPQLAAALDGSSTLTQIAARALSRPQGERPVFAGLVGGMGQLPDAVAQSSGATVMVDTTVSRLERSSQGWIVGYAGAHSDGELSADAVIVATQTGPAARLLGEVAPRAAHELDRVAYASMAVLTFAFPERDLPEIHGSGFLTPPVEDKQVKAATYSFNKWRWVREAGSAQGVRLLRCSVGRFRDESAVAVDDEQLIRIAMADLTDATGICVRPVETHVQRWLDGLPQYLVGHVDRVRSIRREVAEVPGLAICGAAYDGVGIAACISSANLAAAKVLTDLGLNASI